MRTSQHSWVHYWQARCCVCTSHFVASLVSLCASACAQFNMKPEKGIKFLLRSEVVPKEPEKVAHFLRTTPGLDKASTKPASSRAIGTKKRERKEAQLHIRLG